MPIVPKSGTRVRQLQLTQCVDLYHCDAGCVTHATDNRGVVRG
jgi:hypothetical protein